MSHLRNLRRKARAKSAETAEKEAQARLQRFMESLTHQVIEIYRKETQRRYLAANPSGKDVLSYEDAAKQVQELKLVEATMLKMKAADALPTF